MREPLENRILGAKNSINSKKSNVVQGIDPYLNIDDAALSAERSYWMEACGVLIHALRARNAKNPIKYTVASGEIDVRVGNDRITLNDKVVSCEDVVSQIVPFESIEQWRRSSVSDDTILNRFLDQEAKLSKVSALATEQENQIKELKLVASSLAKKLHDSSNNKVEPSLSWPVAMVIGALLAGVFLMIALRM